MTGHETGRKPIPPQVRQVRDALRREFARLIDLSDVASKSEDERQQHLMSRALCAFVVRHLTGIDSEDAAASITDGRNDGGIDAVATSLDGQPRLWLVQAKWSDLGRARVETGDIRDTFDGISLIDEGLFDRFNDRLQAQANRINAVWRDPRSRITVVVAAMRNDPLSREVMRVLEDNERRLNSWGGARVDHHIVDARTIWKFVRDDIAPEPVDITTRMLHWFKTDQPYEAYQGQVAVADVADWYEAHGDRLFAQNIRMSLGLTRVNAGMVDTLRKDPENFFYFNNGIVVLSDQIEFIPLIRTGIGPTDLRLSGVSVVNGAQTVFAAHEAMRTDPEQATCATVAVRVISLARCPGDFATRVTEATNTQNSVEPRDFVALDPTQARIREDFTLSLQKTYVVRRGELDPKPDDGCMVEEAAVALACAHHKPELAALAKKPDLLWERGGRGAYDMLFNRAISAHQIWRSVLLVRSVRETLHEWRRGRAGRVVTIAEEGDLLAAHIIFQFLGSDGIDDPDLPWEDEVLARVFDLAIDVLARLASHVDAVFGGSSFIGSTFSSADRCRILASKVLAGLERGVPADELPEVYRPDMLRKRRQRNTVAVVVEARRIQDGTPLRFRTSTHREQVALQTWLAMDTSRGVATWVNERGKPLLWAADRQRYSPSGLVQHMWRLAGWDRAPVVVQGTRQWCIPSGQSLVDLASSVLREQDSAEDPVRVD